MFPKGRSGLPKIQLSAKVAKFEPKIYQNIHVNSTKFLYNMNTSLHLPKKIYKISLTPITFLKILIKYMKTDK